MAFYDLYPAFVRIEYEAAGYGAHTMTRPTRPWVGTPWLDAGSYEAWDASSISADDMIETLIELFLPLYTSAVTFTGYTIFTVPTIGGDHIPVYNKQLTGHVGTNTSTGQFATFEKVFSFTSVGNTPAKLILLDVPTSGIISKTRTVSGVELALVNEFMSITNAWSARNDSRIAGFRSLSNGSNDALKRAYRL